MRLYEGSVGEFREDVILSRLADKLSDAFRDYYHRGVSPGEVGAWQQSFNFLKNSFEVAGLEDNRIIIEYELPYSSRRIDVLLFGRNPQGDDGVVLVELKQWSNDGVADAESEGNVRVRFASGVREVAHPSLQVEGYHYDLKDFLHVFQDKPALALSSCAYCHNYAKLKEPRVLFAEKFRKGLEAVSSLCQGGRRSPWQVSPAAHRVGRGARSLQPIHQEYGQAVQEASGSYGRDDQQEADLHADRRSDRCV